MPDVPGFDLEGVTFEPFWWAEAPPLEMQDPIPAEVDILVVGGGFTGLSAALELAHGGADVLVVEARRFGEGASSRNGGFISSGINVGKGADTVAKYGQARVDAMLEEARHAYWHLFDVIEREGIRCHIEETGRFVPAHSPSAYEALARRVDDLNRLTDAQAWMLPRTEQRSELASDFYFGGLVSERSGGVHPGLLVRGLALAASRAGARLRSGCAAGIIERTSRGFLVETPAGSVNAREIVLATNGYTGTNTAWHRRRLFPVRSHIIATEELGEDYVRGLFPNLRMISDTKRMLYYFRPSPDGRRILFGGRGSYRDVEPDVAAPELYKAMLSVFPQLGDVQLTHAWTGQFAITFDRLPHIGDEDRLHYALGCNGSGVVMMPWLGQQLALKLLGTAPAPSAYDGIDLPSMPFYNGNPWMLPAIGAWYMARDRFDRWRAGK